MEKICFAASSGGHLEEISRLAPLREGRDCFLLTERGTQTGFCERVYYVDKIDRKDRGFLLKFLRLCARSLGILRREKPDCVITTGALAACPIAVFARLSGKKLIYIESFARVHSASLTGRLLYPFAHLFIVQWEEALQFYPKAVYGGWIF